MKTFESSSENDYYFIAPLELLISPNQLPVAAFPHGCHSLYAKESIDARASPYKYEKAQHGFCHRDIL
jgi:hypothetical protein